MNIEEKIKYLEKKGLEKRRKARWYKKWWGVLLIIIGTIILIYAFSFLFLVSHFKNNPDKLKNLYSSLNNNNGNHYEEDLSEEVRLALVEGKGEYFIGSNNPQATIVIFSDYTCPYCQKSSETIANLAIKYGSKIKIIVRELPILSIESENLAMAALCAGKQDRYWPMYSKLFEVQGEFSYNDLPYLAQLAGVPDIVAFTQCLENEETLNHIIKNVSDAQILKISGVPAWYINGMATEGGSIPFSVWEEFLNNFLE